MNSIKPLMLAGQKGVRLPTGYQEAKDLNLVNLRPWHFVSDEEFDFLFSGINKRYPNREVIPFARRDDNDDVACFVVRDSEQESGEVVIIHNFASSGYEVVARMQRFWEWFRRAVDEMIEWHEAGTWKI